MAENAATTFEGVLQSATASSASQPYAAVAPSQLAAVSGSLSAPAATPWGPVAAVLLCLLPTALLLSVTLIRRLSLPSSTSLPLAAALLAVIRLAYLSSPPLFVLASIARGILESLTPLSVIYGAILLFEAMQHTKCLPWMMQRVKSLSAGEPLAEVFLIGWAFAFMISGVGGFNTPIALAAPMLVSLGHDPVKSLLVVLLLNGLAAHLGSVGMAVWFGFKTLGLGQANILLIGVKSAILVGAISYVIAPLAASFLVPWSQLLRCSVFVLLSVTSAVLPTALVAGYSAEFPVLIGGVTAIISTTLLVYHRVGLSPRPGAGTNERNSDALLSETDTSSKDYAQITRAAMSNSSSGSGSGKSCAAAMWQFLLQTIKMIKGPRAGGVTDKSVTDHVTCPGGRLTAVPPAARWSPDVDVITSDAAGRAINVLRTARFSSDANNTALDAANMMTGVHNDTEQGAVGHHTLPDQIQSSNALDQATRGIGAIVSHPEGLLSSQMPLGSAVDLHNLATVSSPAAYSNVHQHHHHWMTHPWDDVISDATDSEGLSHPAEGQNGFGCEGLWEDHHSAMLTALPASLAAATIHHAALSGVSRMHPWFAGVGAGYTGAAAGGDRQQQLQQQQQPLLRQQHVGPPRGVPEDNSSSGVGTEIQAAADGSELRLLAAQMDVECGMLESNIELTAVQPKAAAAAAAVLGSGLPGLLQKRSQQQQAMRDYRLKKKISHKRGLSGLFLVLRRTLPIWLIVLLLLLTRIPALKLQTMLQTTNPSVSLQLGTLGTFSLSAALVVQLQQLFSLHDVNWSYQVLYVPCLLPFVAASVVTMVVHGRDLQEQQLTWRVPFQHAWQKMRGTFSVLMGAMVLSELISAGGADSPAYIIGYYMSKWLGRGYLAVAGFLGALASFVSGSVMAGNMTFGAIQKVAAERVGVPVTAMLAVQTAGSCAGKMMCISNILSAQVLLNLQGVREGRIIRRTAPLALLFVLMAQAVGLVFTLGGLWPDKPIG